MNARYDVALWRYWPSSWFPYVGEVKASSPLLAVLDLMSRCKLKHAAHVAVRLPDGSIKRWEKGISLYVEEAPISEPTYEEEVIDG